MTPPRSSSCFPLVDRSPHVVSYPLPGFFFFNDTATTEIYTLSLHDALPISRRRKVAVVIEAAFIALLNEAVTVVLSGTPVAPGAGACTVTVGGTSVVKLQRESAPSRVPIASVPPAVTVPVHTGPCTSGLLGVRVATVPAALTVTIAGSFVLLSGARRELVAFPTRRSFDLLLNEAVTVVLSGTPVAPGAGACAVTVGATSVVKLQRESAPSGVPIASVTAAVTVAV